MTTPRVLFILKQRVASTDPTSWSYNTDVKMLPSGLSVSAAKMAEALTEAGIEAKVVQVPDDNSIDKECFAFKPTHVMIEAFWVRPQKFELLMSMPRYKDVKFIVRNHSKSDFLGMEGARMGDGVAYMIQGVTIASNSPEAYHDMGALANVFDLPRGMSVYLPNYYACEKPKLDWCRLIHGTKMLPDDNILHVGCFGAIRPLKNHVHQALAALKYAHQTGKTLYFHINSSRVEGSAGSILRCLRSVFAHHPEHQLIEAPWMSHADFLDYSANMDVVMQVSMSETFNIVAADAVVRGIPTLVSAEVPWSHPIQRANPHDVEDITDSLHHVLRLAHHGVAQYLQSKSLWAYSQKSKQILIDYVTTT